MERSHRGTSVEREFCSVTKKRTIEIGGRHDVDDREKNNKALRNGTETLCFTPQFHIVVVYGMLGNEPLRSKHYTPN
jgi:hypothetical protein